MENNKRVMLSGVRLAFPVLAKPEQFNGTGNPRFSATLLIEKNSQIHKNVLAALRLAAAVKWGEAKADAAVKGLTAGNKIALIDGDAKANYDGFEGNMALSAHSQENAPPRLVDGQRNLLPQNTPLIYAGCYVNASVEIWAQDNQWGKRLNAQLRGVQFVRDGDSFSAARPASVDEFEVVEGAAALDSDFDAAPAGDSGGEFA